MRNVALALRWVALPTVAFFVFSYFTNVARDVAVVALVVVGAAVIVASAVDLLVRRR